MRLMLRDSKTWIPIASNLEPELPEFRLETTVYESSRIIPAASNSQLGLSKLRQMPLAELTKRAFSTIMAQFAP